MNNITMDEVFGYIDEGNFKKADLLCHSLVEEEPENPAVYLAMLMIEMQARNANQIKANLHMYADSDNYKNAVKYDDGRFSELLKMNKRKAKKLAKKKKKGVGIIVLLILVIALVAGYLYLYPAVKYYKAEQYELAGDYSGAFNLYASLGDYKDSFEKSNANAVKYAREIFEAGDAVMALNELEKNGVENSEEVSKLRYDCAMYTMNNMNFKEAASAFELLGDYQDSEQKFHNCSAYSACELSDNGDREGALKLLKRIGLGEDDMFDMKYDHGSFLLDHQLYYDAKLHYAVLGDYRDSIMKIVYIDSIAGEAEYTVTENPDDSEASVGVFTDYSEAFNAMLENENCHIFDDKGIMYY